MSARDAEKWTRQVPEHLQVRFSFIQRALALIVASVGLLAAPSALASTYTPTRGTDFFARDSVWNKPLPPDAPLATDSSRLAGTLNWEASYFGGYINTKSYSTGVYTVAAAAPAVQVTLDGNSPKLAADFSRVPLPADARAATGTDGTLVVWQPSTQTMWEFWRLRKDLLGNWHARWGGKMNNVSSNPGYYASPYGVTATSLPDVAGLITLQEETDGVINHALAFAIPSPKAGAFVFPAQRTDGDSMNVDAIPEGTRFRLPATLNIDALHLPRQIAMMARAAQTYGIIIVDKGGAVSFKAEDPYLFTQAFGFDPYAYAFGGLGAFALMKSFPWRYMQAVAVGAGISPRAACSATSPPQAASARHGHTRARARRRGRSGRRSSRHAPRGRRMRRGRRGAPRPGRPAQKPGAGAGAGQTPTCALAG
jgi:hypothetical protein